MYRWPRNIFHGSVTSVTDSWPTFCRCRDWHIHENKMGLNVQGIEGISEVTDARAIDDYSITNKAKKFVLMQNMHYIGPFCAVATARSGKLVAQVTWLNAVPTFDNALEVAIHDEIAHVDPNCTCAAKFATPCVATAKMDQAQWCCCGSVLKSEHTVI